MGKKQLIGILISFAFIYFSFKDVNFTEFFDSLLNVSYFWTIPAALSTLVAFWLRALRWKYILDPVQVVTFRQSLSATMIGYMANNVLPFRLGEVVRIIVIWKDAGVSRASVLGSLIIERLMDLLSALAVLG